MTASLVERLLGADEPSALVDEILARPPVCTTEPDGTPRTFVAQHAAVRSVLGDRAYQSRPIVERSLARCPPAVAEALAPMRRWPLYSDGEPHDDARRLYMSYLSRDRVTAIDAQTVALARELVREMTCALDAGERPEFMSTVASPMALGTLCLLLDVPRTDAPRLGAWSAAIIRIIEMRPEDEDLSALLASWDEACAYFGDHLRHARRRGGTGLLAHLATHAPSETAAAHAVSLLLGGNETVTGLLGCALLALDEAAAAARAEAVVDEAMRFYSPAKLTSRVAMRDHAIDGAPILAGTVVTLLLLCANRDPAVFRDPHRFDAARAPNAHLGFGAGAHACLGGMLARREGAALVGALRSLAPDASADGASLRWRVSDVLRAPARVRVVRADA